MGHALGQIGKVVRNYVVPAALAFLPPGLNVAAEAAYQGGRQLLTGNSLGDALKAGGIAGLTTYAGNALGGPSTVGSTLKDLSGAVNSGGVGGTLQGIGNAIGSTATKGILSLGPTVAQNVLNTSLGSIGGALAGNSLSSSLNPVKTGVANQTPAGYVPKQQEQQDLPSSLQGFGALDQNQQTSNLANQGTYGGGLGPQENSYFLNLVNRQLVDKSGQTSDVSSLSPIENSYLQKLGLGGYNNSNNLLEAISKWKAA